MVLGKALRQRGGPAQVGPTRYVADRAGPPSVPWLVRRERQPGTRADRRNPFVTSGPVWNGPLDAQRRLLTGRLPDEVGELVAAALLMVAHC
jgi:hypothetical protein